MVKFLTRNIHKHWNNEEIQNLGQNMQCQTLTSNLLTTALIDMMINMASIFGINQTKSLFPGRYGLTNFSYSYFIPFFFYLVLQFLFCKLFRPPGIKFFSYQIPNTVVHWMQVRCDIDVSLCSALGSQASGRGFDARLDD